MPNQKLPTTDATADGTIEECVEAIEDFVATLKRFPEMVLAYALRVHLGALLRALTERGLCTSTQVREFLVDLERDALH